MKSDLFKQYNVNGIGTFLNILYMAAPLVGFCTSIIECGTFYTVQSANIHRVVPWLTFPIFILLLVLFGMVVLFIFYKFIYPNYYAFLNRQSYIHQNPMQMDLAKILRQQKMIMEHLGIEDDN